MGHILVDVRLNNGNSGSFPPLDCEEASGPHLNTAVSFFLNMDLIVLMSRMPASVFHGNYMSPISHIEIFAAAAFRP
jgi:hypothetical protein